MIFISAKDSHLVFFSNSQLTIVSQISFFELNKQEKFPPFHSHSFINPLKKLITKFGKMQHFFL